MAHELNGKDDILDVLTGVFALAGWTYGWGDGAEQPGRKKLEETLDYLIRLSKEEESGMCETGRILTQHDGHGTHVYLSLGYLEDSSDD